MTSPDLKQLVGIIREVGIWEEGFTYEKLAKAIIYDGYVKAEKVFDDVLMNGGIYIKHTYQGKHIQVYVREMKELE